MTTNITFISSHKPNHFPTITNPPHFNYITPAPHQYNHGNYPDYTLFSPLMQSLDSPLIRDREFPIIPADPFRPQNDLYSSISSFINGMADVYITECEDFYYGDYQEFAEDFINEYLLYIQNVAKELIFVNYWTSEAYIVPLNSQNIYQSIEEVFPEILTEPVFIE